MKVALLASGPSLDGYAARKNEYDLVIAVNRAAARFPCDWWVFKDHKLFNRFGKDRLFGCPAKPYPKGICVGGDLSDQFAEVSIDPGRPLRVVHTKHDPSMVAWAKTVQRRSPADWEFNGFRGYGASSRDMWKRVTSGSALMLAYQLGATSIDAYGCDMSGTTDFTGNAHSAWGEERWVYEVEMWDLIEGWMAERNIPMTRVLSETPCPIAS